MGMPSLRLRRKIEQPGTEPHGCNRAIAGAPDHPAASPQNTRAGEAPGARRMPISNVRCETGCAITAYMPASERMRAAAANVYKVENRRGARRLGNELHRGLHIEDESVLVDVLNDLCGISLKDLLSYFSAGGPR